MAERIFDGISDEYKTDLSDFTSSDGEGMANSAATELDDPLPKIIYMSEPASKTSEDALPKVIYMHETPNSTKDYTLPKVIYMKE